jgi:hypothetical protein
MINLSAETYYLGEVFHPHNGCIDKNILTNWFMYVPLAARDAHRMYDPLHKMMRLDFQWPTQSKVRKILPSRLTVLKRTRKWFGVPRPVMKDPIAILSSEWLAETFSMIVIGLIRHPAAFVLSLKKKNWGFPFSQLRQQPQLLDDHLSAYADSIRKPPESFIEQGALAWLCLNHVFTTYIQNHPDWHIWRYEDICLEPVSSFKEIYRQSGLRFTPRTEKTVQDYSSQHNPVEYTQDHLIKRNSFTLRDFWRSELSREEILAIHRIVEPISYKYYSPEDW